MVESWSAEQRLQLLERLSACSSYALIADCFLEPIAAALQASSSVFLEFAARPGQGVGIGRRAYVGTRPWSVEMYADGYFRADPLIEPSLSHLQATPGDPAPFVGALPVVGSWRDSDYYRRFLRPSDIAHVLGITVPYRSALGRQLLCLGFHRRQGDAPFGAAEAELLTQLAPVIGCVLSGIAAREASSLSALLCDRLARSQQGMGFVVFDEDLMVLHAGGALNDLQASGAAHRDGPGRSLLGELRQRLLVAAPQPGAGPAHCSLGAPGGAGEIEIEIEAVATDGGPRYIATTVPAGCGDRRATDVERRLGFTPREAQVARLVCGGYSNSEVGQALDISLRTVENHLRSIYAKARVSSRTRLAARLLLADS